MMKITLPQLSLSMEEGRISRWLVADGDLVATGQPVLEIETDKAIAEIESPAAGTIRRIVSEGALVPVDSLLAEIAETGAITSPTTVGSQSVTVDVASAGTEPERPAKSHSDSTGVTISGARRHIASPAARRVAREREIELGKMRLTDSEARITVSDLQLPESPSTSLRGVVVAHVAASWREIPHIHVGGQLDGRGLAAAKRVAPAGVTITDLMALAVAGALREVPELNGTLGKLSQHIHISIAIATPTGVIAPVIRNANTLSLVEIARERARLVSAARAGKTDRRDLAGGTITMSNLGSYPVDFFAPIISGPQIGMLAIGRLGERPYAVNGIVSVRHQIWVNMAIDHRAADGVSGARFLAALEHSMNSLSDQL
jgi:pyruvate dehydrogenase E2 component (dihydrolipoamide acetyltransferase)